MSLYYIASEENVNYLAHHGVKGQRWGVRKRREQYAVNQNDPNAQQQRKKRIARNVAIGVGATAAAAGAGFLASRFIKNRKALKEATKDYNDNLRKAYKASTIPGLAKTREHLADDVYDSREKVDYLKKHIFKTRNKNNISLRDMRKMGIKVVRPDFY